MLFRDASDGGAKFDYGIVVAYLAGIDAQYPDSRVSLDLDGIMAVMRGMRLDFPHAGGVLAASPFKLAANFACNWVAKKPVLMDPEPFSHVNGVLALEIDRDSLHGATIARSDDAIKVLDNRIELSKHSFMDIAEALNGTSPDTGFKLVSVLFEQMAYKNNPDCQYPAS